MKLRKLEPQIVKKYQSDISKIEDEIIGLYACGMSSCDISENIQDIYGFEVSAETISNITNHVLIDLGEWQSRPLKPVYSKDVVFCSDNLTGISESIRVYKGLLSGS